MNKVIISINHIKYLISQCCYHVELYQNIKCNNLTRQKNIVTTNITLKHILKNI